MLWVDNNGGSKLSSNFFIFFYKTCRSIRTGGDTPILTSSLKTILFDSTMESGQCSCVESKLNFIAQTSVV